MTNHNDNKLREQLVKHIKGGEAYMPLNELLPKIDFKQVQVRPEGLPYSFYELFFHIRLAQYDILEFSRNPEYESPQWPVGYWPEHKLENEYQWHKLKDQYFQEREEFCSLILDPSNDLFKPFAHGSGQTLFRETLLIVEHTSYHTGQLLIILRELGLYR